MASVLQSQNESMNEVYTFSCRPRAVPNRFKYRETQNDGRATYGNIMYDRRVIRGNNYAQRNLPVTAHQESMEVQRQQQDAKRRAMSRKQPKSHFRSRTPEAVDGRKHVDVQTELYLEELSQCIENVSAECQTDAFLDKPPTPLFIPAKSGKDVSTQIEDGELFDFELEVKPVLEVLVGKTMEQALLEVMEEEELADLRAKQRAFQELRDAELVEVQRLEEQERRRMEERERRIQQQRAALEKMRETTEKVAARAFVQHYLSGLVPSVFTSLKDNGYFYDSVQRDVETGFLPWLMDEVCDTLEKHDVARTVLDMIIQDVSDRRLKDFQNVSTE